VAETAQGLKGRLLKKKFVLPIKFWFFTFFIFHFYSWNCDLTKSGQKLDFWTFYDDDEGIG
jgi:hypothetical protein